MCAKSTLTKTSTSLPVDGGTLSPEGVINYTHNKLYPSYAEMSNSDFDYCIACNEVPDSVFLLDFQQSNQDQEILLDEGITGSEICIQSAESMNPCELAFMGESDLVCNIDRLDHPTIANPDYQDPMQAPLLLQDKERLRNGNSGFDQSLPPLSTVMFDEIDMNESKIIEKNIEEDPSSSQTRSTKLFPGPTKNKTNLEGDQGCQADELSLLHNDQNIGTELKSVDESRYESEYTRRDTPSLAEVVYNINSLEESQVWSVLTNTVTHVQDIKEAQNLQVTESKQYRRRNAKQEYYRPDYQNIPHTVDVDNQYEPVSCSLSTMYRPDQDVCATYLYSTPKYLKPAIPVNKHSKTTGYFPDDPTRKIKVLLDSGASKCILSKNLYERNRYLKTIRPYQVESREVQVANGAKIVVNQALKFNIVIAGHTFEVIAYLMNISQGIDFVLGVKGMIELEGQLNFQTSEFKFKRRTLEFFPIKTTIIDPGQTKTIDFDLPTSIASTDAKVIAKIKTGRIDGLLTTTLVPIQGKSFRIAFTNTTTYPKTISEKSNMGYLDVRTTGFYNQSRDHIIRLTSDQTHLLTENETDQYLKAVVECTKQATINRDKADPNDPYPWLDKDDPRRHMTDGEIIRDVIDLTDSAKTRKSLIKN